MLYKRSAVERRVARVRARISERSPDRLRLSVFCSNRCVYAQVIDDQKHVTVASASSAEDDLCKGLSSGKSRKCIEAAKLVGQEVAKRAKTVGVGKVVFDRGKHLFHGRIQALAEAAREGGLEF